jgi:hypothetical protein
MKHQVNSNSRVFDQYTAGAVIAAHASHLGRQQPAFSRWATAALLAGHLIGSVDEDLIDRNVGFSAAERQRLQTGTPRSSTGRTGLLSPKPACGRR